MTSQWLVKINSGKEFTKESDRLNYVKHKNREENAKE